MISRELPEEAIRFHTDEVLHNPSLFNLETEYRDLAHAYRSLNRKLYKILLISDIYQGERLALHEKSSPAPRGSEAPDEKISEFEGFVGRAAALDAGLGAEAERHLNRYIKLKNRFSKLVTISDRFQDFLQQSNKHKDSFISNLSHEIRTPLGTVLGITDLLLEAELNPELHNLVEILADTGNSLMHIIDDVLDLSKVEAGRITIEAIPFNPRDLLKKLQTQFELHRFRRDVLLSFHAAEDIPSVIIGDPHRLAQILSNLLSNALKFTEKGSVDLRVALQGAEKAHERTPMILRFDVKDTGTGIEPEKIPLLFERFTQEDRTISRRYGGSGLGLSIVRELARLMGGSVSVESEKGVGSTFTVLLPMNRRQAEQESAAGSEKPEGAPVPQEVTASLESAPSLRGRRILVAEDAPEQRLLIERFLSPLGVDLVMAEDGFRAVQEFRRAPFDLVFLDLQMPELDGYGAIAEMLKVQQQDGRQVPIIALTAHANRSEIEKTSSAGFAGHITKPFNRERITGVVRSFLK